MPEIDPASTALLLIGYQRDYFDSDGILYGVVEDQLRSIDTLANTISLIDAFKDTDMTMVRTPLVFSADYSEVENPIGILKTIRDVEAFKAGTRGAETIDDLIAERWAKLSVNCYVNALGGLSGRRLRLRHACAKLGNRTPATQTLRELLTSASLAHRQRRGY